MSHTAKQLDQIFWAYAVLKVSAISFLLSLLKKLFLWLNEFIAFLIININWSKSCWLIGFVSRVCIMAIHIIYIVTYLVVQWPEFSVNLPSLGNFSICPSFFKKFDYSDAMVWFPFTVFKFIFLLVIGYYLLVIISLAWFLTLLEHCTSGYMMLFALCSG